MNDINLDHENARRKLHAVANEVGWKTPAGHRASNILQQLEEYQTATGDQKANLDKLIPQQMAEFDRLVREHREARNKAQGK